MELSDEQKQRILAEEQQRLAEEQYRAHVRRELQSQGGAAADPALAHVPTRTNTTRNVLIFVGALVAIVVGIVALIGFPHFKSGQQGAVLEGTYTITGGAGRDVAVTLVSPTGAVILNSGRVSGFGQFKQRLPRGNYMILFDNRFSTFSSKSVSPDLKLTYYR